MALNVFLVHPENMAFLRKKTSKPKLTEGGWIPGSIGYLVALVLAVLFIVGAYRGWSNYLALEAQGQVIQGQYSDKRVDRDSEGDDDYYAYYSFVVNDHTYTKRHEVSSSRYSALQMGEPVQVLYLPRDPNVAYPTFQHDPPITNTVVGGVSGIVALGITIGIINRNGKINRLKKSGRVVKGEVTAAEESKDSDDDRWIEVKYMFPMPDSKDMIEATYKKMDESVPLPERGTPVAVYYASKHNYRLL